ncbi:MAG: hypothetical protein QM811_05340 [Pirellulales bacterium]
MPGTSATGTPTSAAAARLIVMIRSSESTANTPSTMLDRTASCSVPLRPIVRPRSSNCSTNVLNASPSVCSSSSDCRGSFSKVGAATTRAASTAISSSGRQKRRINTTPKIDATAQITNVAKRGSIVAACGNASVVCAARSTACDVPSA